MRAIRYSALAVGYLIIGVLFLAIVTLLGRYTQISLFDTDLVPEHLEQKPTYLASLEPAPLGAPNIVVVFFDDLGWSDLSSYGNRLISTPYIDKAAREGLLMTDFYSASPVCTPSRAALLTGRYPPRTGTDKHVFFPDESLIGLIRRLLGWPNRLPKDEITIADVLKATGYKTGMIGKWHLGGQNGHRPNDFGFEYWYGVLWSNDMHPLHLYRNGEVMQQDEREGGWISGEHDERNPLGPGGIDQSRLTENYTKEAIGFIEQNRDTPFFLYVAHTFPHVPHYPSPDHAGASRGGDYGDVVEDLDRSTGAILATLDNLDLSENTVVFITSDNGADYNGSPGGLRGRKQEILEGGQRVPMIIRWPGQISPASTSDQPAMNIDLFSTVLSLTGQPLPQDRIIDGIDLSAHMTTGTPMAERDLFFFPTLGAEPGAIRRQHFKYLKNTGKLGRARGHLTRLDKDQEAHEISNLYPSEAESLSRSLSRMGNMIIENPRGWKNDKGSESE